MGVSRDVQLRVLKLLDVATEGDGKEIFQFTYSTMRDRWIRLKQIIYKSKRFSLQKLSPQYCTFFKRVRDPSPGKCQFLITFLGFIVFLIMCINTTFVPNHFNFDCALRHLFHQFYEELINCRLTSPAQ